MLYYSVSRLPFVKRVCEIGFNAGHSTLLWLTASPNITVLSFDLGRWMYTKPMAKFLKERFPGRLLLILGDSTKTFPDHSAMFRHRCDIISVDGGHTYDVALKFLGAK